jgi:hypothetical protein
MEKRGLGDVIATITKAVGIEPCEGCKERQNALNRLFPFKTPNQLTEEDIKFLEGVFEWYSGLPLTSDQANHIAKCEEIWLRVFKVKTGHCKSCGSQYQYAYMKDLKTLYDSLHLP